MRAIDFTSCFLCLVVLFFKIFLNSLMWRRRQSVDGCRQLPANNPADGLSFFLSSYISTLSCLRRFFRFPAEHTEEKRNHY